VARIVARAAANHLTPLTLELGGKSPVIVDHEPDLRIIARRILYGKICNSGQICVSPDYVLIRQDKQDSLINALKAALLEFFPNGALGSSDYAHIVNDMHYRRILDLLSQTKGKVVVRGRADEASLTIETTIVKDVTEDDSLMEEEIFGPLLPIVPVASIEDAVEFINARYAH
jgi:aldehyde dehydrogenase (NAD+)